MTTRDLSSIDVVQAVIPATYTTTITSDGVDLRGYDSAMIAINTGVVTDGSWAPVLEESDDDSSYSAVAAAEMNGSFSAITNVSPSVGQQQTVTYVGNKRYVRVVLTLTATASPTLGGAFSAQVIRGHKHIKDVVS